MKNDKKIKITILVSLVLIAVFVLIDFSNIFSTIFSKLNWTFLEIIINNVILIMLFFITYFLIDKRNMDKNDEKMNNQEYVLKQLLIETYTECIKTIELLDNNEVLSRYIVPKVDFNKTDSDNFVVTNLKNSSFKNENIILELFKEGIFSTIYLRNYLRIKNEYQEYISIRITFFDREELTKSSRLKLGKNLDLELNSLLDD